MLDKKLVRKIENVVRQKPRTVQEISHLIGKSWLTADRYVEKVMQQEGSISVRTFRGGTKGALKIVYWNSDPVFSSQFQERLFRQIEAGRKKSDFSPSDIFQHIDEKEKRSFFMPENKYVSKEYFNKFINHLLCAEHQILFFSGNMTFSRMHSHDMKIQGVLQELAEKGVDIKILSRVELPGLDNVKGIMSINDLVGRNVIDVRHSYQPIRGVIIDNKVMVFHEPKDTRNYFKGELDEPIIVVYEIYDEEWIEWLQKVFWHLFRSSISAEKRIDDLEKMKRLFFD